jgi:hypothetical protein
MMKIMKKLSPEKDIMPCPWLGRKCLPGSMTNMGQGREWQPTQNRICR